MHVIQNEYASPTTRTRCITPLLGRKARSAVPGCAAGGLLEKAMPHASYARALCRVCGGGVRLVHVLCVYVVLGNSVDGGGNTTGTLKHNILGQHHQQCCTGLVQTTAVRTFVDLGQRWVHLPADHGTLGRAPVYTMANATHMYKKSYIGVAIHQNNTSSILNPSPPMHHQSPTPTYH